MVLSGKFLPPGDNALDLFNAVESLDPGNQQAARGLERLPDQVFEEASQLGKLGNFRGAKNLLETAQESLGKQARFGDMIKEMDNSIAQQAQEELLQDLLESSRKLIATQPMTLDVIDQSAQALDEIKGNSRET